MPAPRAPATAIAALIGSLALFALLSPADAAEGEIEMIVRKDGTTIVGVIIGFSEGSYRVQVGDELVDIPAGEVRTIEPIGDRASGAAPPIASFRERLAESLGARALGGANDASQRLLSPSLAALRSGDWDSALRVAEGAAAREPRWVDPLLVIIVVRTESGHGTEALRLALRVCAEFPEDDLALEVAAEAFRRGGFPIRAAEIEERIRLRSHDPSARRELARIWWPLDPARARVHWRAVVEKDPRLDRAEFPEAELLRRARAAIAAGDLLLAGQAIEETAKEYPWAAEQVLVERIALAEVQLRRAELAGDLPIATLAAETLERLRAGADSELLDRLARLREQGIERALRTSDPAELAAWVRENTRLVAGVAGSAAAVAARLEALALAALGRGEIDDARSALVLSREIAPGAGSAEAAGSVAEQVARAIGELSERREERAYAILRLLHEHFGAHDGIAIERLREFLASPSSGSPEDDERRAIAGRLSALYGGAGTSLAPAPSPGASPGRTSPSETPLASGADLATMVAAVARWFPIEPGTRWTYRLSSGVIEEREVLSSGPDGQGGWLVILRVSSQGRVAYETRAWIRGGDLCIGAPTAPPGEILLRGALAPGDSWLWRRDAFTYLREVESASGPVETPAGIFEEVRVIRAANSLDSDDAGRSWSAEHRITFAAGIGVIRIEGAAAGGDRELIEFHPGGDARVRPAASSLDGATSSPRREE